LISREELYELVWSKPMTKIAEWFEVSGSYMARICSILSVPRPERGYWAKVAVGKAPEREPLPPAKPGDQLYWSKEGELHPPRKIAPPPKRRSAQRVALPAAAIHGLIRGAKTHFESGRPVDDGAYLKPYKKLLVDVISSKASLDKALGFANDLFSALEAAGYRVVIAPPGEALRRGEIDEREVSKKRRDLHYGYGGLWSPYRPTVAYFGSAAIGLTIVEMSEEVLLRYVGGKYIREAEYVPPKARRGYVDHTWTTTRELPSGRLRLVAYSPYWRVSWSTTWQETAVVPLNRQLPNIVRFLEGAAVDVVERLKEVERQAEIARLRQLAEEERRRKEEDRRCVQQSIKDSQVHLEQIIQEWSKVMYVERFLTEVEGRSATLPDDERQALMQRLELAREFLGTRNPLDFFMSWRTPSERYRPIFNDASEEGFTTDEDRERDGG